MTWPIPIILKGEHATLVPLAPEHESALIDAARDGELWNLWYTSVPAPEKMAADIQRRLGLQASGSMLPFAVLDASGAVVGETTYMNIDAVHKRVEIGSTWYAARVQRTPLNTECKLMLLTHAFETLACIAVEFRTHRLNTQSRRAIERLGAQLDGILRAHQRSPDGSLRDTAVYSITAAEWPTVRQHLRWQLERPR
ncbi:MAG TPA: GNAT family protein [Burkholderiaceae bacterium]